MLSLRSPKVGGSREELAASRIRGASTCPRDPLFPAAVLIETLPVELSIGRSERRPAARRSHRTGREGKHG